MNQRGIHRSFRVSARLACVAIAGAMLVFFGRGMPQRALAADAGVQPFYLLQGVYGRAASGEMVAIGRDVIARRSDGARVEISYFKARPGLRRVVMPDTSATWLLDVDRAKTSWPQGSAEASAIAKRATRPSVDCGMGDRITGHETIAGTDTIMVTDVISLNQRQTFWYAPDLGCEILRYRRYARDGTVLFEDATLRLDLSEPAPTLFDLGKDYQDVPPSELRARQYRAGGEQVNASDFQRLQPEQDREFRALHGGGR